MFVSVSASFTLLATVYAVLYTTRWARCLFVTLFIILIVADSVISLFSVVVCGSLVIFVWIRIVCFYSVLHGHCKTPISNLLKFFFISPLVVIFHDEVFYFIYVLRFFDLPEDFLCRSEIHPSWSSFRSLRMCRVVIFLQLLKIAQFEPIGGCKWIQPIIAQSKCHRIPSCRPLHSGTQHARHPQLHQLPPTTKHSSHQRRKNNIYTHFFPLLSAPRHQRERRAALLFFSSISFQSHFIIIVRSFLFFWGISPQSDFVSFWSFLQCFWAFQISLWSFYIFSKYHDNEFCDFDLCLIQSQSCFFLPSSKKFYP